MNNVLLTPIGKVSSPISEGDFMPTSGQTAWITVFPEYAKALERIEEYSHIWVLSWLHLAKREVLTAVPRKINPSAAPFGIFALRSPNRPNPIALSLVRLLKKEEGRLQVADLDAINGTPILDIKPYFERDTVFSPQTPHIPYSEHNILSRALWAQALNHHGEACADMQMAVRMALFIEEHFGYLKDPELKLEVIGSPCLADCLQGLTRARFANPPRFLYQPHDQKEEVIWRKGKESITLTVVQYPREDRHFMSLKDDEIFLIRKNTGNESLKVDSD